MRRFLSSTLATDTEKTSGFQKDDVFFFGFPYRSQQNEDGSETDFLCKGEIFSYQSTDPDILETENINTVISNTNVSNVTPFLSDFFKVGNEFRISFLFPSFVFEDILVEKTKD